MRVFARTSITEYVGSSISRFVYHCEFVAFHCFVPVPFVLITRARTPYGVCVYIYTQTCKHVSIR